MTLTIILLLGLAPFVVGAWLTRVRLRSHSAQMYALRRRASLPYQFGPVESWPNPQRDYRHVEGLGTVVGNILCRYNARSAFLRCAVNPSGPCAECFHYEEIAIAQTPLESSNRAE